MLMKKKILILCEFLLRQRVSICPGVLQCSLKHAPRLFTKAAFGNTTSRMHKLGRYYVATFTGK